LPQALAEKQLLKHAPAPPQSSGQRLELAEGTSLANTNMDLFKHTLPHCASAEIFFSCCGSVEALPALAS
jgi:hypothetical protein